MTTKNLLLTAFGFCALLFTSCEKTPVIPNEEEVITTVYYTLTPNGGGSPIVLSYRDLDGNGGNAPVITSASLNDNTTYTGRLEIINETLSPADTITPEIQNEAEHHQFFFQNTVNELSINYNDTDLNGKPLGIVTNLVTGNVGSGNLKIILRHQPNKSAVGVAIGDITNAGGETDIELTFNITVQ